MSRPNYPNDIVDKTNRKRLYFYSELTEMLNDYSSSSEKVNDLLYELWYLSNGYEYVEQRKSEHEYETKGDKQLDENTFERNVWKEDLILHSIFATIKENSTWSSRDRLYEITEEIYFTLDKIIHPDYRPGLDYADVRYNVEIEYIDEDKIKEYEDRGLDFRRDDWRA